MRREIGAMLMLSGLFMLVMLIGLSVCFLGDRRWGTCVGVMTVGVIGGALRWSTSTGKNRGSAIIEQEQDTRAEDFFDQLEQGRAQVPDERR